MPIFSFVCQKCHGAFEELLSASLAEKKSPPCPSCGSANTERQLSAFAVGANTPACGRTGGDPPPSCGSCGCAGGSSCPF